MKKLNSNHLKIIAIIGIFLLSFPAHFLYDLFPNSLTSIFFPVNESIWEHMKIIFTTTCLYGIIDYILLRKNNIAFSNFKAQLFITSFFSIPIYLAIYLPLNYFIGENLFISIFLLLITYTISQIISYYILSSKPIPYLNFLATPLIILIYILFTILTYLPPHNYLFYDTNTNSYGIPKEHINSNN